MAAMQNDVGAALGPYFRRYELPWSPSEEMDRRFRTIRGVLVALALVLALVITFLPRQERVTNTDALPERVVKLVMEPPPPPPPPPPPKPQPKPLEKTPTPATVPTPKAPVDPRVKAAQSGLLAHMDDLAALRDVDVDKFAKDQAKTTDPGDVSTIGRSMITSKAGSTSGGIAAPTSSGLAAGAGSLNGIRTAQIKDPALAAAHAATRAGGSGKGSRSADEVALVFDKNKGAIYALYTRALRDNPALQGKVVVEVTIAPSGEVTGAKVISTELNDPEFEAKLLARVRLYKFDAEDVAALTATREIDFFPAG
jgi:TonB family protein